MKIIFEFKDYKTYLEEVLGHKGRKTGKRAEAARFMGCQTAYLSQVMNGDAHLSLEQAFSLNDFLGHDSEQADFFLLLVQKARAGTKPLRQHFEAKIQWVHDQRSQIKNRLQAEEGLPLIDQTLYYSRWYYACLHVMISIPSLQTLQALASHLTLPTATISEALDFLVSRGLADYKNGRYSVGSRHLHLPHDSPLIAKHHMNWRTQSLVSLDSPRKNDLHYSMVGTLSREDAIKIRERMVELIEGNQKIFAPSKEEATFVTTIDFFEI